MTDVLVMFDREVNNVPLTVREDHIEQIKEAANGEVYWCKSEAEALEKKIDAEVLFAWVGTGTPPDNYCTNNSNLRWIHTFSAGVNALNGSPIKDLPIKLTNAKGIHGRTMSVVALGFIISLVRGWPYYMKNQKQHIWQRTPESPGDLWAMTLCIVGAGAIAADLAKLAKAVGMHVTGVKRSVTDLENFDKVYSNGQLDEALAEADVVVVLAPGTPDTFHMIDAGRFKCMKNSAYLINISRGTVVDEAALADALKDGEIAGAALDAVEAEPLSPDSPLWDMDNVIITPHCSADRSAYVDDAVTQFCELLKLYQDGQPLFNEIALKENV